MALMQLSPEEVQRMSVEEKDAWWLKNVFKGNMPQLTLRAAITGMIIGGALSLTNLYIAAKTGWTLGVGVTSVILAFAFYKVLSRIGLGRDFTVLENNAMQSVATAAGYMTSPLTSSLAAYMMVTNQKISQWVVLVWIIALSMLGVLFAFPLKRRFINDEQHPFPEGRAAGIVMDALHTADPRVGMFKAQLLVGAGLGSACLELLKSARILDSLKVGFLKIPDALDSRLWNRIGWHPTVRGVRLEDISLTIAPDHVMFATGGLMGFRVGLSMIIGATINCAILGPLMIAAGDVKPDAIKKVLGFKELMGQWSVWPGVAILTVASLVAFFSKPRMLLDAFAGMTGRRGQMSDQMRLIELPMSVFLVGIPVMGGVVVYLGHRFFNIDYLMGIIAIPLVFAFSLIAVHSTALTAITPGGAIGKLTQLTFGVLAPNNITTNVMTAGISGETALNASNLLMDIKPGYMLGAKPRQQAVGHVLGILAGAVAAVPVFYLLFLSKPPSEMISDQFGFPSAVTWKAVADILTKGLRELPTSAGYAAAVGAFAGLTLELIRLGMKGRFPFSPIGFGLGFLIHWHTCFAMFLGAFVFHLAGLRWRNESAWGHRVIVSNQEPICAGIIAGGALMGIATQVIELFFLK